MSHVASVQCYVQDLDALEAVAARLGLELVRGATSYAWFGTWVGDFRGDRAAVSNGHDPKTFGTSVHKLRRQDHRQGDYEIGLVPRLDGQPGFELLFDNWGHGGRRIQEKAGKDLLTLKNELAAETTQRILARQGYRWRRSVNAATGDIVITATK